LRQTWGGGVGAKADPPESKSDFALRKFLRNEVLSKDLRKIHSSLQTLVLGPRPRDESKTGQVGERVVEDTD
jgi:hypothetical protein